jgi:Family of unknown function (DUF6263)
MKPVKGRVIGAGVLAALLLTFVASPSQAETLRWKFKKGQKLNYAMTQKMNMSTSVMGMAIEIKMTMIMDMAMNVKAVKSDGSADATQKITRVRMKMEGGPFGKIEYDSVKKDGGGGVIGEQFAKSLGPLVNAELTMTMTPRGEVKSMKIPAAVEAALKKAGGGNPVGGGFSADSLKQMTSQMGAIFPEGPVVKGQSWSKKTEADTPQGKMVTNITFKYAGTSTIGGRKVAKLELSPKFSLTAKPGAAAMFTIKDKGSSGASYFDVEAGVLTNSSLIQNMEMDVMAGGVAQTMNIKSEIEFKLVK